MVAATHLMSLSGLLGDPIEDAYEETFFLFSEGCPSHNLGFVDSRAGELDLEVAGRTLTLKQSPDLLTSQRDAGTTGAVLWKITPLIGEWLASKPAILQTTSILGRESTVVELGCGITGLIGILVAPEVSSYVLTDQAYVMRALHHNINANGPTSSSARKAIRPHPTQPSAVPLDWEINKPSLEGLGLQPGQVIDLVVVCDCVYNEYLVKPLVETLVDVCRLNSAGKQAAVLVAQQLRSETIFELFLATLLERFDVWRLPDDHLAPGLRSGSGYAVHMALLKAQVE